MHFFVAEIFVVYATKRGFFWTIMKIAQLSIYSHPSKENEKNFGIVHFSKKKNSCQMARFLFLPWLLFCGHKVGTIKPNTQLKMKYLDHVIFVSIKKGDIMENVQESQNLS